jgi:NAD+ synthase
MPSPYTSCESIEDAEELAKNLGIQLDNISIAPAMDTLNGMLAPIFKGRPTDTTEENLQSRLRGNILMAISNKLGLMLLTTGNKSEMSVGYATLYGDMCGGYSVLKDVYKTTLFKLSHWRNRNGEVIPERMITKPPSAELKADQKDEDSLPPYDVLDAILLQMIEYQQSVDAIVAQGFEREVVEFISKMLYTAEFKRRQAPPGVKITEMSFGRDRRYPITNKFKDLKNRI